MVRKSEQARAARARQFDALIMRRRDRRRCVLGLLSSAWLTTRILRPLGVLRRRRAAWARATSRRARACDGARRDRRARARVQHAWPTGWRSTARARSASCCRRSSRRRRRSTACPIRCWCFDAAATSSRVNRAAEPACACDVAERAPTPLARAPTRGARADRARCARTSLAGRGAVPAEGARGGGARRHARRRALPAAARRADATTEDGGDRRRAPIVLQDVTRLLRFDELKNDLVATVAHEFRTPLTSLRMALHLCAGGGGRAAHRRSRPICCSPRARTASACRQIVDELLNLSRIQSGQHRAARSAPSTRRRSRATPRRPSARAAEAKGIELGSSCCPAWATSSPIPSASTWRSRTWSATR